MDGAIYKNDGDVNDEDGCDDDDDDDDDGGDDDDDDDDDYDDDINDNVTLIYLYIYGPNFTYFTHNGWLDFSFHPL